MLAAGYDPNGLIAVMDVLEKSAGGGARMPEFLSTHPFPAHRKQRLRALIDQIQGRSEAH